jgi:hypothetical protein
MNTLATLEETVITFEKRFRGGGNVRVTNVPAEIVHRLGKEDLSLFNWRTSSTLLHLLHLARNRVASGETEIVLDFQDDL